MMSVQSILGRAPKRVCTRKSGNPAPIATRDIVEKIIVLAEYIAGKDLYPYQREFALAFVESVLERDGEIHTALFSRQSGKTEVVASLVCALALILPVLARQELFQDDYRFNLTDDQGNYRGFRNGVSIGIYAPKQEQADIMFNRITSRLGTDHCKGVMNEMGVQFNTFRGTIVRLSHGTHIRSQSASENSKIEGETYHILILEEAQDLGTMKVRKSLHPMCSSVKGSIVKIGTCSTQKSDFYHAIRTNMHRQAVLGKRLHFYFPHQICERYNSLYAEYVEREKQVLGEDSDEFRMAYKCEWLLDRGMFISESNLAHKENIEFVGKYGEVWTIISKHHGKMLAYEHSTRHTTQVAGIDFGKVSDPTVVTIIDVDWAKPVFDHYAETLETAVNYRAYRKAIVAWLEVPGDNYEIQFNVITEFLKHFRGLKKITLDATGVGQWGYDKFVTHYQSFEQGIDLQTRQMLSTNIEIEGFNFQSANQSEGYKLLQSDILAHRLKIPMGEQTQRLREHSKFLGQMLELRKEYTAQGHLMCKAPDEPDAHDDYCDSLMLANWGANSPANIGQIEASDNMFMGR